MFSKLTDVTAWQIYSYLKAALVKLATQNRSKGPKMNFLFCRSRYAVMIKAGVAMCSLSLTRQAVGLIAAEVVGTVWGYFV